MRTLLVPVLCCILHTQAQHIPRASEAPRNWPLIPEAPRNGSLIPEAPRNGPLIPETPRNGPLIPRSRPTPLIPNLRRSSFLDLRAPESFDVLPIFGETSIAYAPPAPQNLKALPISYDDFQLNGQEKNLEVLPTSYNDFRLNGQEKNLEVLPIFYDDCRLNGQLPLEKNPAEHIPYPPDVPKEEPKTSRLSEVPLAAKQKTIATEYGPPALPELPPLPLPTFAPPSRPERPPLPLPTYGPPVIPERPPQPLPTYGPPSVPERPPQPLPTFAPPATPRPTYLPPPGPTYLPPPSRPLPPLIEPTHRPPLIPELPISPPDTYGPPRLQQSKAFSYSFSINPPAIPETLPPIFSPPASPRPTYLPPPGPTYLPPPSRPLPPLIEPTHRPPLLPTPPISPPDTYGPPRSQPSRAFSYSFSASAPLSLPNLKTPADTPLLGPLPSTTILQAPALNLPQVEGAPLTLPGISLPKPKPTYLPPSGEVPPSSGYGYGRPKTPLILPTEEKRPSYKPFSYSFTIAEPKTIPIPLSPIPPLESLPPIVHPLPKPTYLPPVVTERPPSGGYAYGRPKTPLILPTAEKRPSYKPFSYSFTITEPKTIPIPLPPIPPLESLPPIVHPLPKPTYLPPIITERPPSGGYAYNRPKAPLILPTEEKRPSYKPFSYSFTITEPKTIPIPLPPIPPLESLPPIVHPLPKPTYLPPIVTERPPPTGYSYNRPKEPFILPTELDFPAEGLPPTRIDLNPDTPLLPPLSIPSEKDLPSRRNEPFALKTNPENQFLLPAERADLLSESPRGNALNPLEEPLEKSLPSKASLNSFERRIDLQEEVEGPQKPVFGDRIISKSSSSSIRAQSQKSGRLSEPRPSQQEISEPRNAPSIPPSETPIIPPPTPRPPVTETDELETFEDTTPEPERKERPMEAPKKKTIKDFPYSFVFPGSPFALPKEIPQLAKEVQNNQVPVLPNPSECFGNPCEKDLPDVFSQSNIFETAPKTVETAFTNEDRLLIPPVDLQGPISQEERFETDLKSISGPSLEEDLKSIAPYPPSGPPYPPAGIRPFNEFLLPNELPVKK